MPRSKVGISRKHYRKDLAPRPAKLRKKELAKIRLVEALLENAVEQDRRNFEQMWFGGEYFGKKG